MALTPLKRAEILRLHAVEKWRIGTIARQLGLHHRVVSRVLNGEAAPVRAPRPRLMTAWRAHLEGWLARYPSVGASRLHDMLKERGFVGSERTVRREVSVLRPRHNRAYLQVETLPGEQAQVDWADVGFLNVSGGVRKLHLFVMTLSWSRGLWGEFVLDLGAATLCRSLCRAAQYFGGLPRVWLFDNTKAVVLERVPGAVRFNPLLLQLAATLCVEPRLCAPYQPRDKGKVERAVRYLRDRFLAGRHIESVAGGNERLLAFLADTAGERPHPTQSGKTVALALKEEQPRLLPLPAAFPDCDALHMATVDRQAFVPFETNRYSVPPEHVGRTLTLRVDETEVRILHEATLVARHQRAFGKRQRLEDPAHRTAIIQKQRASREHKGRDRLLAASPHAAELMRQMLLENHNMGLCTIRMLKLLDLYGPALFHAAVCDLQERGLCDPGTLALACETARRKAQPHLIVPATFAEHVKDGNVNHMKLEDYDDDDDN